VRTHPARAGSGWLALREPADAAARAVGLVEELEPWLPTDGVVVVHDLGCGTGSMARWLAPLLDRPQHWVMVDRDEELTALADAGIPEATRRGGVVTSETRRRDITRLAAGELEGAALVTASALLDMLTGEELERLLRTCAGAGCPVLVALSVTGRVDLAPADPFDRRVGEAFNAHQRRRVGGRRLLGPDAVGAAVDGFRRLGLEVLARPSPWRLGPDQRTLVAEWFTGWLAAACEQAPGLAAEAHPYAARRLAEARAGQLSVTVHHRDLLALPARTRRAGTLPARAHAGRTLNQDAAPTV
jgi:hypothetical protein